MFAGFVEAGGCSRVAAALWMRSSERATASTSSALTLTPLAAMSFASASLSIMPPRHAHVDDLRRKELYTISVA